MVIIVDTREQLPLFTGEVVFKLLVGDYSTMKLRHAFAVERKSMADLYGTITKGHVRFRNELIRAEVNGIKLVMYVEGTREEFINKQFPRGNVLKIKTETLDKIMNTIEHRYKLEIVWCKTREHCREQVLARLRSEQRKFSSHENEIQNAKSSGGAKQGNQKTPRKN